MRTGQLTPSASGVADVGTRASAYASGVFDCITLGSATFDREYPNGNSGANKTINWTLGNKQAVTLSESTTLAFTSPKGACNLVLRLTQGAGGSKTVAWPGSVLWPTDTAPTLSTTAAYEDIACFYFNGSNYYGMATMEFR